MRFEPVVRPYVTFRGGSMTARHGYGWVLATEAVIYLIGLHASEQTCRSPLSLRPDRLYAVSPY